MKNERLAIIGALVVAVAVLSGCTRWTTRYSGKDDQSNTILVNLYKDGHLTVGHCGVCRTLLDGYSFELKPIRPLYTDDEITLMRKGEHLEAIKPVKGTVSFDQMYSKVTINIQIFRDGRMASFPGNGTFRINAED